MELWDVPPQQVGDAVDRVFSDVGEDMPEIELRIEAVEFGRSDERVEGCGAFTTLVRSREEIVFPSQRDDAQRASGSVVVDLNFSIVDVPRERSPTRERIADRSGHIALGGEGLKRRVEPCS